MLTARVRAADASLEHGPPLFLGYLLLQAVVVAGLVTPDFPDTESYGHLSLTGADTRLPTVPLIYKLLPTDSRILPGEALRVAGQTLLAAVAWWVLARVASQTVADRRVRLGLRIVLLMLGLVAPIASWNSVALSESIAISLTALLIAAWLVYVRDPRTATAAAAVGATLFWTFTRQTNVLFGLMIAGAGVVAAFVCRDRRRLRSALAVLLVAISVAGLLELRHNRTLSNGALEYMIDGRILPHAGWTAWFANHGMPNPRFDPSAVGEARPENPTFVSWLDKHGESTYVHFVLTHPGYTLLAPLRFFSGEKASLHHPNLSVVPQLQPNPTPSLLSPTVNYARHRDVLPSVVQDLLFDEGQIGDLITLTVLAGGLAWFGWKRLGPDRRYLIPALVTLSAIPQGYIVWLSGGEATHELDRLSMVTAVSVRIGMWIVLAIAVDRLAVRRLR